MVTVKRMSTLNRAIEEITMAVTYSVTGMSCGHCEKAVTEEVSALPGVTVVAVDAKTGLLTVEPRSEAALDDEAVRAAVDEAGYELVGRAS